MKTYSKKQLQEAVLYWKNILGKGRSACEKTGYSRIRIVEAIEKWQNEIKNLNERNLSPNETNIFAKWITDNKVDVAELLKLDKVESNLTKDNEDIKKAYDIYKKASDELKFTVKSIPAFHRALKAIFANNKDAAKDPKKAAEFIKDNPDKVGKELKKEEVKPETGKDGGKETGSAEVGKPNPAAERAIENVNNNLKPEDVGVNVSTDSAQQKTIAKPIGNMNLMNRLHRLHNATVKNVEKKLKSFLPWSREKAVEILNSCDQEDGTFVIPDDGNMIITVKVKISDVDREGFKKFIGGVFGKAVNEEELDQITEGFTDKMRALGGFIKGAWEKTKEGARALGTKINKGTQKAADWTKEKSREAAEKYKANVEKVNEEMKKRVGVTVIQEYILRFCGKALAKKVNYQNIETSIENEGTESATYVFVGCVKITK